MDSIRAINWYPITNMSVDQLDSLEGWVAIKDHPFMEKCSSKAKVVFTVVWDELEGKLSVKCQRLALDQTNSASCMDPSESTGVFTFGQLRGIHQQLSLVHPSLASYLPRLPSEPRGLWAYIAPAEPADEFICEDVLRYFKIALDICGDRLLLDTLFEEHSIDEYFEKISELRRRAYDDAVSRATEQLESVLFLCEGSINMLDMAEVYKQEDEVNFCI